MASWTAPANAGPAVTDYDYRYRVTAPQGSWTEVTTTAITGLSATITGLAEDTEYDVQVRATNDEGTSGWSDSGSGSTDANAAPTFTSAATFDAAENQTAVGTVVASDGDADDSVTGYTIQGGADASTFSIVEATGVLTFASAPNFEAPADADTDNGYVVVVRATSGTGARLKTADQTITVTVTDVAGEAPGVPAVPTVTSASESSVMASWTAPANAGPAVTDYDYRYRVTAPQGSWTEVTTTAITALSATITGLAEDTEYDVQVRATNDEGTSGWSDSGSGSTDANAAPTFTSAATFDAAENQTVVGTVVASDGDADDSVTGYTIQGGADASTFSIVEATGVLTFASAPNFEAPADADADNGYVVVVRATSGTGARLKTADQTITVTVTDVAGEAPGVPAVPMVTAASESSVMASWTAPANAGPAITDYDYRYRVTAPQGPWTEVTTTAITGLSATITGLAEDTEYDVQVRATNDEGTSGWSDSGSGSTDANAAPTFTSAATFDAAENQTAVGTVVASDGDTDDSVTGYAIQGGADASTFSIVEATGVLTFASAPNFEAPADADADNAYVVVVRATSGTGARLKTADQTITVTVTDVAGEAPGVPAVPTVSSASVTSVTAAWTAPANAGPAITDYDYRYRVTSPQGSWTEVTTTAITGLSATITGLAEDTEYDVQVRATNDEGTSGWSDSGSGSTDANAAPTFTSAATFDAAENQTVVGTVVASDGDADDSVTGYTIQGGADRSKFSIVETSGVLTFASAPNFEAPADADADNAYVVVVRATSGTGARLKTADQTITVTVTDVAGEAPGVPAVPMVTAASVTSVTAAWTAPANAGPAITDYDYRYRVTTPQGSWTEVTTTAITGLSATITGLAEDTEYDVQVRATNDEGTSGWSASGSGSTDANAAPAFTSAATFDAAENQTAVGTVVASDGDADDSVTGYTIQGGADRSKFSIVETSGVLTFASAPNFEAPADADTDNAYVVVVRATSGTGARAKTADQTITVTVTDVAGEAPGVPAAPMVTAASESSVMASWTAPANAGPAITDYDYRYRVTTPQGPWTEVTTTAITGLSATITGLAEDTEYDVQVRATNDEGTSGWSASGSGSTDANAAPAFTSAATFDAAENQTAVGTVVASDSDADDSVTGYTIQGGADRSKFSIVETSGVLTFASAPNFEAPADADADNAYVVVVRATSGTGARAKTADQTITVTVTDVAGEAPRVPAAPMVTAASVTSVTAAWTAPVNAGPPITDYDYRYRVTSPQGSWTEVTTTALSATITGLAEDTGYDVQVRATNDEGTSGWSLSGSGSTDANAAPTFTSAATFDAAENQTAVGTVVASDGDTDDTVTGYAIQGGADASKFSIVETSGVLTFASAPNFEAPADADTDNAYVVVVRAASGTGARVKTADQTITVTVTDVAGEAPRVPAAPMVTAASVTSVTAAWTAPANAGPPITDYDYRYRVTSPQGSWTEVTTTAITALSATITGLVEDTGYDVQVRATNDEGTSGWSASGSGSTDANAAPTFTSAATFDAAENQTAVGTVQASDGDADDSVTGYAIQGGTDRSKFSIVETSGVLTFASAPNFEAPADADADNAYVVVVRAASGTGARAKTADQTITVTVTDVAGEAPGVPAAPMVTAASVTNVTAAWTAPANAGPPITDYDYRYRVTSPQGSWTEVTTTAITALSATITGLAEDTGYDVQVRATTDEGTSGWSASGSGSTDANAAPAFTSAATFDAAENQTAVGTVQASDGDADDSVTGYAIQGGADRSKFSIVETSGVLTFASAPNFEAPADADTDNAYVVVVRAASGTGARAKTADQTITVTVTDVAGEAPGVPAAPMVSAASVTSVTAAWTAPANAGPPITDYDYRYRVTTPQGSWTEVTTTAITALSATITGLAEDTGYDVQVRATTDEGMSGWSASGSGSTDANAAPAFTSAATFDAAENQTAVGTVQASDGDADDSVTGYAIQGGADRSKFSIVETSGVLTFASAPNFEAPADADTDNAYVVVVRAASGTGARAKTADQTITVTVTDVAGEAPGVPAAPMVSAASVTSVTAAWTAPANAGPPITDYDYRYRVTTPQGSWTEVTTTAITALSATITGLAEDTGYDVQVRATTDEGTSGWSASGSGSTDANAGQPTISGVAQVGSLLTAGKGTIADVNGTTKADNGDSGYAYTYQWIRVDGGTETNISGATSSTYTPVDDDEGKKIKVRVSFQDDANHSESRTSAATATVTGNDNDTEPAISIADASAVENAGHLLFEVTLSRAFQNTVKVDFETISGGTATEGVDYYARRTYTHVILAGDKTAQMGFALIEDTVAAAGETVKVRLSNARVVDAYGDKIKDLNITTDEATGTINAPSTTTTTVPGLTIRIRDATGDEDDGYLDFRVRLSRKHNDYVCYDFESILGGTATEGTDYLKIPKATYWMQIGKRVDTPFVRLIDDSENDNGETVKVKISNAHVCGDPSQTLSITRAEATGTIRNSDPLPQALMARFGRTAAVHVVEHVEERLAAPREVGVEAQVAGRQLRPDMGREMALDFLSQLRSSAGMHTPGAGSLGARSGTPMGGMAGPDGGLFDRGLRSMGLGGENLLTNSSFALTRETRQGGILSFWSRGARSSFAGREGALSLGGDVRTTMVGADYAKGPLVTGLSLSNSRGLGEYAGVSGGQVASAVTGLYPWLGYKLSDRVSVWGVTGYGKGALTLTPGEAAALTSGLSMAMAAAGTRGALVGGGASGFELAFKADALWVGTSIDGVEGPGGNLTATAAAVTRFRTGLEGARGYTLAGRLSLRPSVEVGLRHDGGDAETGAGLDVGGGLVVSDASTGLAVDLRVRTLVMHQADGFRERGMALSLSYNPTPSTPLGFTARVAPSWGGEATSGAEAMWGRETIAGLEHGGGDGTRLDAEVGYGLPVGSRFVGTPRAGVRTSEYGRDYRVGYGLGVLDRERLNLELGVDAHRRESPMLDGTDHGALARATMRW